MAEDDTRVWTVMTPEEGSFAVNADDLDVVGGEDRVLLRDGKTVGVFPPGFAVWLPEMDEEDTD